jgi:hypothetical protein
MTNALGADAKQAQLFEGKGGRWFKDNLLMPTIQF